MASNPSGVFVDPLNQADMGRSEPTPQPPSDPVTSPANPPSTPPGAVERPWHFVLAETNLEGADRLAAFCLEHGLEVMVISRHNTGLARIIALPGQASSSRDTASVRAQEDQIVAIGRRWKQNGGRTDFSDRYMDRIEPAPR